MPEAGPRSQYTSLRAHSPEHHIGALLHDAAGSTGHDLFSHCALLYQPYTQHEWLLIVSLMMSGRKHTVLTAVCQFLAELPHEALPRGSLAASVDLTRMAESPPWTVPF